MFYNQSLGNKQCLNIINNLFARYNRIQTYIVFISMKGQLEDHNEHETTLDNLMEGFQLIGFDWKYLYVNDAVVK